MQKILPKIRLLFRPLAYRYSVGVAIFSDCNRFAIFEGPRLSKNSLKIYFTIFAAGSSTYHCGSFFRFLVSVWNSRRYTLTPISLILPYRTDFL